MIIQDSPADVGINVHHYISQEPPGQASFGVFKVNALELSFRSGLIWKFSYLIQKEWLRWCYLVWLCMRLFQVLLARGLGWVRGFIWSHILYSWDPVHSLTNIHLFGFSTGVSPFQNKLGVGFRSVGLFLGEEMLNNNNIPTDLLIIGTLWREYVRLISEYVSSSTSQSIYHFFS